MYIIKDNLGNEAEADDLNGALLAAKTLFEDNDGCAHVIIVDGSRIRMGGENGGLQ